MTRPPLTDTERAELRRLLTANLKRFLARSTR